MPCALNDPKETILNDNSRSRSTTFIHEDAKLLLNGDIQGYLNAPPGSKYEKGPSFTYKSTDIMETKYFSTILTDSYSGTIDGLIATLAISAISSEDSCVKIMDLKNAFVVISLKRFDHDDQEMVMTTCVEDLDIAVINQIIILAQNSIIIPCISSSQDEKQDDDKIPVVKKQIVPMFDPSKKIIRQLQTVQAHTKKWHELQWNTCPNKSSDLAADVAYRLNLCGTDSSMRVKVLRWRDNALKYYDSYEYKTNQTPKWKL